MIKKGPIFKSKWLFIKALIILGIAVLMLSTQVPFFEADPDRYISGSRGANTDEGLNSCQIRNFIHHGDITMSKSDNLVKTPLFSALLFVPFKVFGTSLLIGRLSLLLVSISICLVLFFKNDYWLRYGVLFFVIVYGEYYIFHFFHFCLAEILSSTLIFAALYVLVESRHNSAEIRSSFLSALCISLAYFLKIQFLYAIVILPLSMVIYLIFDKSNRKKWRKQLSFTILFTFLFLMLYYYSWYVPNKELFEYVMLDQTSNRFANFSHLWSHVSYKLNFVFYNDYLKLFTLIFYASFIVGVLFCFRKPSGLFTYFFISISCWIIIEMHKLTMIYLPTRYLISLFFPMGLLISAVLLESLMIKENTKIKKGLQLIPVLVLILLLSINANHYYVSLENRAFSIKEMNEYLELFDFGQSPVMGAWAPSLTWNCNAMSYPIWNDYFNDESILEKDKPAIIIQEIDEADSNQAFISEGINIDAFADSIKYYNVHNWKLKIMWMHSLDHKPFK